MIISLKKNQLRMIPMNNIITLDYSSRISIYEQIINEVEKYVALGILKEGEQIPSIRDLASTLGINPNTVRKAYQELERKGVINTLSTKGTFITNNTKSVTEEKIAQEINKINKIIKELEKLGLTKTDIIDRLK